MYSGITPSCTGTIIVMTITTISAFAPRKSSFAKAKPASALKKTTEIVTAEATMNEFTIAPQKSTFTSPELKSREMLWKSCVPGREHRRVGAHGRVVVRRDDERPVEREEREQRDDDQEHVGEPARLRLAPALVLGVQSQPAGDRDHG